jgi:hypothetical protein
MSPFERLKYERRLIVLETQATPLELAIAGYRDTLRDLLDPLLPVGQLQGKVIADLAVKLAARQIDLRGKLSEVEKIKALLGKE